MVESLSIPFKHAIIRKFSHSRQNMEQSYMAFNKLGLKGTFPQGHLDPKHILIGLQHEGDFNRLWMKETVFVESFLMEFSGGHLVDTLICL